METNDQKADRALMQARLFQAKRDALNQGIIWMEHQTRFKDALQIATNPVKEVYDYLLSLRESAQSAFNESAIEYTSRILMKGD